ncbi:hypothetical protein [Exiguobacterium oxidotolerans]|uniref:Uncharacterized protein n=1 Tax=Exiguobacterium oxidotolerans TaxID=223958 RepID=A0A653IJF6_9BACL|nr:hypothetical protein [Exiguobacterium oxidotolerans]VWX38785.1 hypothetical protein EXIGUO9Y_90006 [Exiguobacterium oxidotolerans]
MNLTKDMDAALDRLLEFYDEEGIEYFIGAPGTGKMLVTDGDEILGELLPVEDVSSFVELHSMMSTAQSGDTLESVTNKTKIAFTVRDNNSTPIRMGSSSYGVAKKSMLAVA